MRVIEVNMEWCQNEGAGEQEIPEKTRRPTASSGTIPTCENLVTGRGLNPVRLGGCERTNRSATVAPTYTRVSLTLTTAFPRALVDPRTPSSRAGRNYPSKVLAACHATGGHTNNFMQPESVQQLYMPQGVTLC
ncbi:hypothetical protein PR048_010507 [Dryococelus australis]|uniref:Uncharacterized protein n=1 Tax=Dryococelus australis TaxID=614101 RepID=A0ABQ9I2Y1_9NEOP|nr:hypothetical protein PR048_010507 [Dryococelus australis]